MAQVNMITQKLQDLQFFNKLEKPGQVALENNCSFSVNFTADNTKCIAKLYQCVKDKSEDADHKFFISVEMVGIFAVDGPVTDEDKKDLHVSWKTQHPWLKNRLVTHCFKSILSLLNNTLVALLLTGWEISMKCLVRTLCLFQMSWI